MITAKQRQEIIDLIKKEVVPALGCTEPVAVALATARATEALGREPDAVEVRVSGNIYKNGMGVGIPGTGMTGLPIAAALGAVCCRSEDGLELFKRVNADTLSRARAMLEQKQIKISVKEGADKLYVESICKKHGHTGRTIISHRHTHIVYVEKDGQVLFETHKQTGQTTADEPAPFLNMAAIYEFADQSPVEEIDFILKGAQLNRAISDEGLTGNYGLKTGFTIQKNIIKNYVREDLVSHAMAVTAAASDARMDGCALPVMSNSGSGNQGITTILPVLAVAEKTGATREKQIRALILSNLAAIYMKRFVGQLTALCGILTASTGAACGICYLLGGTYDQICGTINNMAASITGMICDGAKQGCALKVSSGVSTAVYCAMLSLENSSAGDTDGIISRDVEITIQNIGELARKGMLQTDQHILETLLSKS